MKHMQEVQKRRLLSKHVKEDKNVPAEMDIDPVVSDSAPLQRSQSKSWVHFVMEKIWSLTFLGLALFGLYEANFVSDLLYASQANRIFVHLSILFGTLLAGFGCYIEVYRSMILGQRVHYDNAKTATHGMVVSLLASGLCMTIGMWPVWHWLTLPYLFMWFWGVVLQLLGILPPILLRVAI